MASVDMEADRLAAVPYPADKVSKRVERRDEKARKKETERKKRRDRKKITSTTPACNQFGSKVGCSKKHTVLTRSPTGVRRMVLTAHTLNSMHACALKIPCVHLRCVQSLIYSS